MGPWPAGAWCAWWATKICLTDKNQDSLFMGQAQADTGSSPSNLSPPYNEAFMSEINVHDVSASAVLWQASSWKWESLVGHLIIQNSIARKSKCTEWTILSSDPEMHKFIPIWNCDLTSAVIVCAVKLSMQWAEMFQAWPKLRRPSSQWCLASSLSRDAQTVFLTFITLLESSPGTEAVEPFSN